jgi:hypothetical protein
VNEDPLLVTRKAQRKASRVSYERLAETKAALLGRVHQLSSRSMSGFEHLSPVIGREFSRERPHPTPAMHTTDAKLGGVFVVLLQKQEGAVSSYAASKAR